MSDWYKSLPDLWAHAWQLLGRGSADNKHAFHTFPLATVAPDGTPQARMVVLRGASASAGTLTVQTDRASAKIDELQANPAATFLFWDRKSSLQVRARCTVTILTGDAVEDDWQALSEGAATNYGGQPPPATPMADPTAYRETAERERFAVLRGHVESADILHLGDLHRRALFSRDDGFAGTWLAP
ncbi:pyridoxamine 5'-phosphate oxidase [Rhodobacteraceae bacterium THAF1]|uniref:pyridoxamine 5'-phosphate oxidase family protein n=1 Tax=Palleronia sp. THAF1 TaxID=2587842 RepID=UPI000F3EBFF1|nr:pyridoxamine 5'-phosphate oxidase family protein [Palleronia sp. THAF1]QFU08120.1 pyridoxamine 5'-phosphate oxidase [Palleronia sp. THAF1]VDC27987.1 pyridoxamine 5'-phosphate oxidase [Rhodobacteraceae bacterium THAF1]